MRSVFKGSDTGYESQRRIIHTLAEEGVADDSDSCSKGEECAAGEDWFEFGEGDDSCGLGFTVLLADSLLPP